MAFLVNIHFPDGSWAIGPFHEPVDHPDIKGLHRYDLRHRDQNWVVYHNEFLSAENEAIIRRWIDQQDLQSAQP
jgi:hypothetical protein